MPLLRCIWIYNASRGIDAAVLAGAVLPLANTTAKTFEKAKALAEALQKWQRDVHPDPSPAAPTWDRNDPLHVSLTVGRTALSNYWAHAAKFSKPSRVAAQELTTPVSAPEDAEVDAELLDAIDRLCTGKNGIRAPVWQKRARAQSSPKSQFLALAPKSEDDWAKVNAELEHRIEARKLVAAWNAMAPEFRLEQVRDLDVTGFRELVEMTEHIKALSTAWRQTLIDPPQSWSKRFLGSPVSKSLPDDHDAAREELASSLRKHLDRGRLSYAIDQVGEACQKLDGASGPVVDGIRMFLSDQLGSASVSDHDIAHRWREHLAELRRLAALRTDLVTIERVICSIANSGAELWAKSLRSNPATADTDTLLPAAWLRGPGGGGRQKVSWKALRGIRNSSPNSTGAKPPKVISPRPTWRPRGRQGVWLAVHEKSPDNVRQALQEYLNEIQAIGKGTGIRAIHHRLLARAAMERAYPAVPCWIMPQWRVSESIPAKIGSFDHVVNDEASQSDIWAMPALPCAAARYLSSVITGRFLRPAWAWKKPES